MMKRDAEHMEQLEFRWLTDIVDDYVKDGHWGIVGEEASIGTYKAAHYNFQQPKAHRSNLLAFCCRLAVLNRSS